MEKKLEVILILHSNFRKEKYAESGITKISNKHFSELLKIYNCSSICPIYNWESIKYIVEKEL